MKDNDLDVITFLLRQHEEIRTLFQEMDHVSGPAREEVFQRLVRTLSVHETAEEELVHPYARRAFAGGDKVVDARLREENAAKELLSRLDEMGTDHPEFPKLFEELRTDVLAHAEAEEREEFPKLKEETGEGKLRAMTTAVKAIEAMAPTHPHPGVESAKKNILMGPAAAIMDRTRDAIRAAMGKTGS
ncbi:hemerythrin domain-containing protein [Streptosporangium sp. NPDC087985]|uniref:hemerythrin domain-containing protein n=1 Tax=Streptosporangium sp. NPDC087985 TaxID=3366196 RepID=UPI003801F16B